MNVPNLNITIDNNIISAIPYQSYLLTDLSPPRLVVLYKLSYFNSTTGETITSIIPYYISDGQTNNFRANMLFPFICVNEAVPGSGCPSIKTNRGLLFKYHAVKNFDIHAYDKYIIDEIKKIPNGSIIDDILKKSSMNNSIGVSSVFRRLTNILDFFIAFCSERIATEYPIEQYRPNLNNPSDALNFTMNTYGRNEQKEYIEYYDKYRSLILMILQDNYNKFVKEFKIINNVFTPLSFKTISLKDFNNLPEIKLCTHESESIRSIQLNYYNYTLISIKLGEMIQSICDLHTKPEFFLTYYNSVNEIHQPNFIASYAKFFNFIKRFLHLPKSRKLEQNIDDWNAKCYNKYLKYKSKYLKLKKNNHLL
jgi:hypothetical protein